MIEKPDRPNGAGGDADQVASLLRLAGRRPDVPAAVHERVKERARETWREQRDRRRRRRRIGSVAGVAALLVSALVLVWFGGGGALGEAGAEIRVERVAGLVLAGSSGAYRTDEAQLRAGDVLQPGAGRASGTSVDTGPRGRVALRLSSGHGVRLDAGTRIALPEPGVLDLVRGAVYVDSGQARDAQGRAGSAGLRIRTAWGAVREVGTRYEVRNGGRSPGLRVRVRSGRVLVEHEGTLHAVDAGTQLQADPSGQVRRDPFPSHHPDWSWTSRIAPMMDIQDRTAHQFLEWAAREGGWSLAYESAEVARHARETVLAGSIGDLTLDQALETVLPTCRLRHRTEAGVLEVGFGSDPG